MANASPPVVSCPLLRRHAVWSIAACLQLMHTVEPRVRVCMLTHRNAFAYMHKTHICPTPHSWRHRRGCCRGTPLCCELHGRVRGTLPRGRYLPWPVCFRGHLHGCHKVCRPEQSGCRDQYVHAVTELQKGLCLGGARHGLREQCSGPAKEQCHSDRGRMGRGCDTYWVLFSSAPQSRGAFSVNA